MMGVRWGRHSWRALQDSFAGGGGCRGLLLWLRGMTQETQVATRRGWVCFCVGVRGGALAGLSFRWRIGCMRERRAAGAGVVYAVDLFGSCLAALGLGLWALPVLGATTTLGLLAFLTRR